MAKTSASFSVSAVGHPYYTNRDAYENTLFSSSCKRVCDFWSPTEKRDVTSYGVARGRRLSNIAARRFKARRRSHTQVSAVASSVSLSHPSRKNVSALSIESRSTHDVVDFRTASDVDALQRFKPHFGGVDLVSPFHASGFPYTQSDCGWFRQCSHGGVLNFDSGRNLLTPAPFHRAPVLRDFSGFWGFVTANTSVAFSYKPSASPAELFLKIISGKVRVDYADGVCQYMNAHAESSLNSLDGETWVRITPCGRCVFVLALLSRKRTIRVPHSRRVRDAKRRASLDVDSRDVSVVDDVSSALLNSLQYEDEERRGGMYEEEFGRFYEDGGSFVRPKFVVYGGRLRERDSRDFVDVFQCHRWLKSWDIGSNESVYFCFENYRLFTLYPSRLALCPANFFLSSPSGVYVRLPLMWFYCYRSRRFVFSSDGWCWVRGYFEKGFIRRGMSFPSFKLVSEILKTVDTPFPVSSTPARGWLHYDGTSKRFLDSFPGNFRVAGDGGFRRNAIAASAANALNQEELYEGVVTGITQRIMLKEGSQLVSRIDDQVTSLYASRSENIKRRPAGIVTPVLSSEQKSLLTRTFPELNISFRDNVHSEHAMCNSVRMCFNALFSSRYRNVKFVDIGGSVAYHIKSGNINAHCCNPILDFKDARRRQSEVLSLIACDDPHYNIEVAQQTAAAANVSYCSLPTNDCSFRAVAGFMVDVYDLSVYDVACAMAKKDMRVFDLCLMFPIELTVRDGVVVLNDLNTIVERKGNDIFYTVGGVGEAYRHNVFKIRSFFTAAAVTVPTGETYSVEYSGYRLGYHTFSLSLHSGDDRIVECRRSIRTSFAGKTIVRIPKLYGDLVTLEDRILDSDFVDRMYSYLLNTTSLFADRTFEYAVSTLRSQKTHFIVGTRVVHDKVELPTEDIWGVTISLMIQAIRDRKKAVDSYRQIDALSGSMTAMFRCMLKLIKRTMGRFWIIRFRFYVRQFGPVFSALMDSEQSMLVPVPNCICFDLADEVASTKVVAREELRSAIRSYFSKTRRAQTMSVYDTLVRDSHKVLLRMKEQARANGEEENLCITEDDIVNFIENNRIHMGLRGGSRTCVRGIFYTIIDSLKGLRKETSESWFTLESFSGHFNCMSLFPDAVWERGSYAKPTAREVDFSFSSILARCPTSFAALYRNAEMSFNSIEIPLWVFAGILGTSVGIRYLSTVSSFTSTWMTRLRDCFSLRFGKYLSFVFFSCGAGASFLFVRSLLKNVVRGVASDFSARLHQGGYESLVNSDVTSIASYYDSSDICRNFLYRSGKEIYKIFGEKAAFAAGKTISLRSALCCVAGYVCFMYGSTIWFWCWASGKRLIFGFCDVVHRVSTLAYQQLCRIKLSSFPFREVASYAYSGFRTFRDAVLSNVSGEKGFSNFARVCGGYICGFMPIVGVSLLFGSRSTRCFAGLGLLLSGGKDLSCGKFARGVKSTAVGAGLVLSSASRSREPQTFVLSTPDDANVYDGVAKFFSRTSPELEGSRLPDLSYRTIERINGREPSDNFTSDDIHEYKANSPVGSEVCGGRPSFVQCDEEAPTQRQCDSVAPARVVVEKRDTGNEQVEREIPPRNGKGKEKMSIPSFSAEDTSPSTSYHPAQGDLNGNGVSVSQNVRAAEVPLSPVSDRDSVNQGEVASQSTSADSHFIPDQNYTGKNIPSGFHSDVSSSDSNISDGSTEGACKQASVDRVSGLKSSTPSRSQVSIEEVEEPGVVEAENNSSHKYIPPPVRAASHSECNFSVGGCRSSVSLMKKHNIGTECPWIFENDAALSMKPRGSMPRCQSFTCLGKEAPVGEYILYLARRMFILFERFIAASVFVNDSWISRCPFPKSILENLPGLRCYSFLRHVVDDPTGNVESIFDLDYVFCVRLGRFLNGKSLRTLCTEMDVFLVSDDILVFHDALNIKGAVKIARSCLVGEYFSNVSYQVVNSPPGGGKTTQLVKKFFEVGKKGCIATANLGSAQDINTAISRAEECDSEVRIARTANSWVVNTTSNDNDFIGLIDEVYMLHFGMLQCCVKSMGVLRIICYGDINQIPFINREKAFLTNNCNFSPNTDNVVYTNVSYRCPADVCYFLSSLRDNKGNQAYPGGVCAYKDTRPLRSLETVPISSAGDLDLSEIDAVLTYTQDEKNEVKREVSIRHMQTPVFTVHEAQGKTFGDVLLVRLKKADDSVFKSRPHNIVALSRHTRSLRYATYSLKMSDATSTAIRGVDKITVEDAILQVLQRNDRFRDA